MTTEIPYYHQSIDYERLMALHPPPPHHARVLALSQDELHAMQSRLFMARVTEAWELPFYRKRWSAAGLEPGDIRGLDDIEKIPTFTSDDLRTAIDEAPPFGNHHPLTRADLHRMPMKIHTSGGTTGMPRATVFDPVAMEVQGIQTARAYYAQGGRPGDVVQIPFTMSLANAAWTAYTGAHKWLGATPLTTGSGNVTPSERQLQLAAALGTNGWYIAGPYLGHLTQTAMAMNFDLRQLPTRWISSFFGHEGDNHSGIRAQLEQIWGAPVFDNYGTHEHGLIAFECASKTRHINEDTVFVEIRNQDDGSSLPHGEYGDVVATALYRSVPVFIRYNLRDRMSLGAYQRCACGLCTRTLSAMTGRNDEMIKLRGTNVFPAACASAIERDGRSTGEYICVVQTAGEGLSKRDEMTVRVERNSLAVDATEMADALRKALHNDLGVRVEVEIADPGALREQIYLGEKPRRKLDLRGKARV